DDRGARAVEAIRRPRRGRERDLLRAAGRGGGVPGPQRSGQDHHDAHADRLPAARRRQRLDRRARRLRGSARRAPGGRLPARDASALSRDERRGLRRVRGEAEGRAGQGAARRGRPRARALRPLRRAPARDRRALEGLSPARRARPGDRARPGGADPRRAHGRARPDPDPRNPRADRPARRREAQRARAHGDPLDPHPPGGGGDLPPRADHQPRAQGRRPAARRADARRRQPRGGVRARDGARAGRGAGGVRRGGPGVRHVVAIAGRELRSLFASPVAYAVLVLFAVLAGFFFLTGVLQFQDYVVRMQSFQLAEQLAELNVNDHVIAPFVHVMSVVLLFLIPGITMGLFAAEKANGTQELLLTSPITIWELVIGKFLAAAAFVTLLVLLLGLYVGLLFWYGDPEIGKTAAALGGLWLVGLTYAAI